MPKFDDGSESTWGTGYGEAVIENNPPVSPEKEDVKFLHRYSEPRILKEIQEYIDSTYSQHYSRNKFQATEFILDSQHGDGFCIGNIMKYAQRYGKKDGYNRKDLLKIVHYAIIALHNHDLNERG